MCRPEWPRILIGDEHLPRSIGIGQDLRERRILRVDRHPRWKLTISIIDGDLVPVSYSRCVCMGSIDMSIAVQRDEWMRVIHYAVSLLQGGCREVVREAERMSCLMGCE